MGTDGDRQSRWVSWWPRLSRAQVAEFQEERREGERRRMLRNVLIAMVVYAAFAPADLTTVTDLAPFALVLRLGVITPLIFLTYLVRAAAGRRGHALLEELPLAFTGVVVQGGITTLMFMTRSPHAEAYFAGFFTTMIYFAMTLRVRLSMSIATLSAMCVVGVVGVHHCVVVRPEIADQITGTLLATLVLLLVMVVSREVDWRRNFLLRACQKELLVARESDLTALHHANEQLAALTELDELTRLPNRRAMQSRLDQWDAQARWGVIAMVDVDRFKTFNDVHGHATGDACLRLVASAMQEQLRADGGFVARYGGEEFTLVLPGADETAGAAVTERLREAVAACDLGGLRVTISIGWASCDADNPLSSTRMLQRADDAVLAAKAAGRDCVVHWALATPVTATATA